MQKYQNNVTDRYGNAAADQTVTVNVSGGGLATLYADNAGTTKTNPFKTDQNGYFAFYAADGRYDVTLSGGGYYDVLLQDSPEFKEELSELTAATGADMVGYNPALQGLVPDTVGSWLKSLEGISGASLVGFLQGGTGAVLRSLQDKNRERVSVMDYLTSAQIADTQAGSQVLDLSAALQAAVNAVKSTRSKTIGGTSIRTGGREIELAPGVYRYSTTLLLDGDIVLRCAGGHSSAVLQYTGTGDAIVVNSTDMTISAPQNTRAFRMDGVSIYAPAAARGLVFGGATQRHVELLRGQIIGVPGRALDCGQGVYFLRLGNFELREGGEGAYVGGFCDLFTVDDRCFFGGNSGPDLILECPTFLISNSDFEGSNGATAHIRVSQANLSPAIASVRAAMIIGNRFGPEGANPVDYDIEIVDNGVVTAAEVTTDLKIWGNNHFSASGGTAKISPVNIASKTRRLDIRGNRFSANYSSGFYAVSTDVSKVYATGFVANSEIDNVLESRSEIRGLFRSSNNPFLARAWTTGTTVTANTVVRRVGSFTGADRGTDNVPTVAALVASGTGSLYDDAFGISVYDQTTAGRPVWIATTGNIINTTLDTTGSTFGAPVYLQASGGLGLTATAFPLIVGRVHTVGTNAAVLVSIENEESVALVVNADITARGFRFQELIYNTAITADRTVTLNSTNPTIGDVLRVTRTAAATGAFNVICNGRNLAANTFVELAYTSSGWLFTASGAA